MKQVLPVSVALRGDCCVLVIKYSNLPNTTLVATKLHMMLKRSVVLAWMHDNRELVVCEIMEYTKSALLKQQR